MFPIIETQQELPITKNVVYKLTDDTRSVTKNITNCRYVFSPFSVRSLSNVGSSPLCHLLLLSSGNTPLMTFGPNDITKCYNNSINFKCC